ncbi:hypothetical protein AIOL_002225 [Candidatus Rhodobacter oscarellae]|uniref:Uncharacterized protein n=1 Tax=Candidatus Rhodobacter oscarellae TaxID=1675527 RepID=A0A0J9E618_9RHOB|nr:hypothetical protein AIOL_002225 [Candidatus Rhodobacter lobularis]
MAAQDIVSGGLFHKIRGISQLLTLARRPKFLGRNLGRRAKFGS